MASVDQRSAAEIEREIESERSALTRTLDEIQERLSFESLSGDFVDRMRENSGDIGRSVARGVKDNPIPLAITAVGLTWLIISQRNSSNDDLYDRVARTPASARRGSGPADYRDPGAVAEPAPLYDASGRPIPNDDEPSRWDRARGAMEGAGRSAASSLRGGRDHVAASASSASHRAQSRFSSAQGAARSRASAASGGMRRRAQGAYASASELRDRIMEGTEDLSESARKRVIAARTRAYEAQLRAEHYASRSREKASDLFEDQPLVVGALALAAGAAIGGMLPRTSREDDAFGAYRDQIFDDAERVYHEERAKFETVARETVKEAQNVARDVADDVSEDVKSGMHRTGDIARGKLSETEAKAKDAANKVADTAKSEAEKQNLGQQN